MDYLSRAVGLAQIGTVAESLNGLGLEMDSLGSDQSTYLVCDLRLVP